MNGGAKPRPGDKGWRAKPTDTWGEADTETMQKNADLRRRLEEDPGSLSAEDKARAEVLAARSARKREKKDRMQQTVKRNAEEKRRKNEKKGETSSSAAATAGASSASATASVVA